jgi:MFS family permease
MPDQCLAVPQRRPDRRVVVTALGVTQILAWGSTFYLIGVLANAITSDTDWGYDWVISGVTVALLTASVVSPRVGRAIGRWGGRPVLAASSVVLAAGLFLLGCSQSVAWYLTAWLVLGVGMGAGLTDAAFSTLGRIYGDEARSAITSLTLFAGFASTICWPLTAYLVEYLGWREACFIYATVQLVISLPILLLALPRHSSPAPRSDEAILSRDTLGPGERATFALTATVLTLSTAILAIMGIHLLPLLVARGLELATAVGLGAIVGPAQVGARVVEMLVGRHYHPIWTMIASAVLVAAGAVLLLLDLPIYALAIMLYGAGNGIGSVARGTLPLALFGPLQYPALMGRLAVSILMSMALAPLFAAVVFEEKGAELTFGLIAFLAAANVFFVGALFMLYRRRSAATS